MALAQRKGGRKGQQLPRQSRSTLNQSKKTTLSSKYRSKYEAAVAASVLQRGLEFQYEAHSYTYTLEATYTPDFFLANGVVVETKGLFGNSDRRKMLAIKAQYPLLDIRLCFMNAQLKLSKAPKSITYWQWAERHGFPWCQGHIPTTWFNNDLQTFAA